MNFHASVLAGLYVAWFPCEIICPGGQAMKWGTLTTAYSPQSHSFLQNSQRSLRQNIYLNSWGLELMEPGAQRIKRRFIKARENEKKKVPFTLRTKRSPADSGHSQGPGLSTPLRTEALKHLVWRSEHLLSTWPQQHLVTSLCLSFHLCEMTIIIYLQNPCEESVSYSVREILGLPNT